MKSKGFWVAFAVVQIAGLLLAPLGNPNSKFRLLELSGILLFPGSAIGPWILDRLSIPFGYVNLPVSAVLVNLVCWCLVKLQIDRIRRKE